LALQLVLINPNGWSEGALDSQADQTTVTLINKHSTGRRGYFSWTPTAITKSGTGPFAGRGSRESSVRMSKFEAVPYEAIAYSLAKSQLVLSDKTVAYTAFASVAGSAFNPSEVVWDFSVGYGVPPVETNTRDSVTLFLGVAFAVMIGALLLCVASNTALSRKLALAIPGKGVESILGYTGDTLGSDAAGGKGAAASQISTSKTNPQSDGPTVLTYGQTIHLQGLNDIGLGPKGDSGAPFEDV